MPLVAKTEAARAPQPVAPSVERSHRKLYAIGALATGGAAIVTGAIFGGLASSKWSSAKGICGGTTCGSQAEIDQASALGSQARTRANVSTAMVIAGAAIASVGVVLWVTAPTEPHLEMTAHASIDGASVTFAGRF